MTNSKAFIHFFFVVHKHITIIAKFTFPSFFNFQNLGFVRIWSQVQTAQFKLRSRGLMLDEDMHRSLKDLPEQYDVTTYFLFLNTYGTHYVTEGTLGGTMEYIVVANKTAMSHSSTVACCLLPNFIFD